MWGELPSWLDVELPLVVTNPVCRRQRSALRYSARGTGGGIGFKRIEMV